MRSLVLSLSIAAALAAASPATGASAAPRIDRADVWVQPGSHAPVGIGRLLRPVAAKLRSEGVPTKFVLLRTLPRRPIRYSAVLRAQHRRRTGEDANVIIAWPRFGYVAFDARVADPEEETAWQSTRRLLGRTLGRGMATLAGRLAASDAITGGLQPARGPIEIEGPEGPVTARPCVFEELLEGPCRGSMSSVALGSSGNEVVLRVTVSATCAPGPGPYRIGVAPPLGWSEYLGAPPVEPVVCASGAAGVEERRFEFSVDIAPGRRSYNAPWQLLIDDQPVGQSALVVLRRNYLPASFRTITERQRDDFFNICLDGEHRLRSAGGVLYCTEYSSALSDLDVRTD